MLEEGTTIFSPGITLDASFQSVCDVFRAMGEGALNARLRATVTDSSPRRFQCRWDETI
jgi:hypothetical protein